MSEIVAKQKLEKTLKILNSEAVVSSVDISRIFEKQHKHTLEKIRELIKRGAITDYKETTYINSRGRIYACYLIFNEDKNKLISDL